MTMDSTDYKPSNHTKKNIITQEVNNSCMENSSKTPHVYSNANRLQVDMWYPGLTDSKGMVSSDFE